jgi:hypothetical protein
MQRLKLSAIVLLLVATATVWLAAKEFSVPRALPAKTYPAHDEHPLEQVTVAIDPYDSNTKASLFHTDWRDHGYLPVRLIISNDGDRPITLTQMKIELITANRSKIQPATNEDLYRRVARTKRRGDEPNRLPIPLPRRGGPQVGVDKDTREEVEASLFRALAVEPHGLQSGFLFFDISGIHDPLPGARLYVTGVRDGNGQDLMYFEIPLEKYLTSQPNK